MNGMLHVIPVSPLANQNSGVRNSSIIWRPRPSMGALAEITPTEPSKVKLNDRSKCLIFKRGKSVAQLRGYARLCNLLAYFFPFGNFHSRRGRRAR
jgi:hypothetical protein